MRRLKNRLIARLMTVSPSLSKHILSSFEPVTIKEPPPWHPPSVAPSSARVALVTTAGVHKKTQRPFDMKDPEGDASYRVIESRCPSEELLITHDYYDHRDADRDINTLFPIERLWELKEEGLIGDVSERHYSFMGHITGEKVRELSEQRAPEVARMLLDDGADIVIFTPG